MALFYIHICEPSNTFYTNKLLPVCINAASRRIQRIIIRNIKFSVARMDRRANPQSIIFYEWKNLFIMNRIHISDNDKVLFILYQLHNKFTKVDCKIKLDT